jgi:hypothetical protein
MSSKGSKSQHGNTDADLTQAQSILQYQTSMKDEPVLWVEDPILRKCFMTTHSSSASICTPGR